MGRESSGVVASSVRDGIFFTHNDSGDLPRFFAVDDQGCTLVTYTLGGVESVVDVEDIARGPSGGESSVWLGDIGDNNHMRNDLAVHRVIEPNVNASPHRRSDGCPTPAEETVDLVGRFCTRHAISGVQVVGVEPAGPTTATLVVRPLLDQEGQGRLRGCLEDATLDRHVLTVVQVALRPEGSA